MAANLYPSPRPRSIGEVLDAAFVIFKATLPRCLPFGLLAMITCQLQSIYDVATGRPLGSGDLKWWVFFVLGNLLSIALWSAVIVRQKAVLEGRLTSVASDLGEGLRQLPAVVAAMVLGGVAVACGLALLVIPGVYLMLAFLLAWPAILLSGKGPFGALRYSVQLISGSALRVFTVFSVGLSMVLVFDLMMFLLVAVLLQFAGTGDLTVVTSYLPVVVIALGAVTAPFLCALGLALYGDLQVRRELRLAGAAAPAMGEPAPVAPAAAVTVVETSASGGQAS